MNKKAVDQVMLEIEEGDFPIEKPLPDQLGVDILNHLGIDTKLVQRVELLIDAGQYPVLKITQILPEKSHKIKTYIENYKLIND